DGLLFAVVLGFRPERSERIMRALDGAGVWTPWGPRCAVPDYSFLGRGWITRLAGIPDYHDRMVWMWLGALAVRAWLAVGRKERALELAGRLAEIAERDGAIGEVYEPEDGRPVKRLFYRSESPFSWGSGM